MFLEVNGKRMQTGNTRTMIFGVAHLVSYVSQFMRLDPGDVITTGTPPGVGMGMKPKPVLPQGRRDHPPRHRRARRADPEGGQVQGLSGAHDATAHRVPGSGAAADHFGCAGARGTAIERLRLPPCVEVVDRAPALADLQLSAAASAAVR